MKFIAEKVVAFLPPPPYEPNTLYKVRTGTGYDEYLTDNTGATAHPLRWRFDWRFEQAGRIQAFTNERWVTNSDDIYGTRNQTFNENCGTGADPIQEWEHNGVFVKAGTRIKELTIHGRSNNTQFQDFEILMSHRRPNDVNSYETGVDSDTEMENTTLFRDFFFNPNQPGQPAFTGNGNDKHRRIFPVDQTVTEEGEISLYFKPQGNITANRYYYVGIQILFEELL